MSTCFDFSLNSDADSYITIKKLHNLGKAKIIDCLLHKLKICNLNNDNDTNSSICSNNVHV